MSQEFQLFSEPRMEPAAWRGAEPSTVLKRRARIRQVRSGARDTIDANGLKVHMRMGYPVVPRRTFVRQMQLACKRLTDIVLSAIALLVLGPLLILVALAIKLTSPGPILFRQERLGTGEVPFDMWKFRTLYVDQCDPSGVQQVGANDSRVTLIGHFLRRHSIDELPQLLNILVGEMSLVGPRPHVPEMEVDGKRFDELVAHYNFRYLMKPGLSGWAQANGLRGGTYTHDAAIARTNHDCAYVQNFSLFLDFRIIVMTLWNEIFGRHTGSTDKASRAEPS